MGEVIFQAARQAFGTPCIARQISRPLATCRRHLRSCSAPRHLCHAIAKLLASTNRRRRRHFRPAGGRVRTDKVNGFLLDRGFQIFLTSYPEARAALDYDALQLKPFYAGALVRSAA